MPDFLRRLILLAVANVVGCKMIMATVMHKPLTALVVLVTLLVANLAIWKWEFQ